MENSTQTGPKRLYFRHISENPTSGAQRWEMSKGMEQEVAAWLEEQGKTIEETVRGYRETQGRVRFTTGIGYAILDADVLGGEGSGKAERRFEEERNVRLVQVHGRRTGEMMAEW